MQLNYFTIKFDFDQYQIKTTPYSEEHLSELRSEYNTTHSFFRNGDAIYISNKDGDDINIPGTLISRTTYGDNQITSSLIKHLFFRTFKERFPRYIPVDFYPFRFFSAQAKDDIIYNALPDHLKTLISYKKLIEIQLRLTEINGAKQFGFLINIKRNWVFSKSCAELHQEGYNLIGVDVLHAETFPGLSNVLAPNEELIGVIIQIDGNKGRIETNEGLKEYNLDQLFIKKSKYNIGNYLSFAISQQKSDEIMAIIESQRPDIYNPKKLYDEIIRTANHLFYENGSPILFHNKDGFCFTVDNTPISVSNSIELRTPTFIFDPAAKKTNNFNPDLGLSNYGPYDSSTFDIKTRAFFAYVIGTTEGIFLNFYLISRMVFRNQDTFRKGYKKSMIYRT